MSPSPPWRAPDLCEPLVGWRVWAVSAGGRLLSPVYDEVWTPLEAVRAYCRERHEAPRRRCSCGVHATRSPGEAARHLVGRDGPRVVCRVLGEVALWGRVVECERGWRGELAYPVRLLVPAVRPDGSALDADLVASLLAPYRVPVDRVPGRTPHLLESVG